MAALAPQQGAPHAAGSMSRCAAGASRLPNGGLTQTKKSRCFPTKYASVKSALQSENSEQNLPLTAQHHCGLIAEYGR